MARKKVKSPRRSRLRWIVVCTILSLVILGGLLVFLKRRDPWEMAYNQGVISLRERNIERAVQSFERATQLRPQKIESYRQLLVAQIENKSFAAAYATVDASAKAHMSAAEQDKYRGMIKLAEARQRITDINPVDAGGALLITQEVLERLLAPAARLVRECTPKLGKPVEGYALQGDLWVAMSDINLARYMLQQRIKKESQSGEDPEARRKAESRMMDEMRAASLARAQAEACYEKALQLQPKDGETRLKLARLCLARQRPNLERARELLETLTQDKDRHIEATTLLAQTYGEEENWGKVLDLTEGTEGKADRKMEGLLRARSLALVETEKYDQAMPIIQQLLQWSRTDLLAHALLGRVHYANQRYVQAAAEFQSIFQGDQDHWPEMRYRLGMALLGGGSRTQALVAFRKAVQEIEEDAPANMAMARRHADIYFKACAQLARELVKDTPEEAAAYAVKAMRADPANDEIYQLALQGYQGTAGLKAGIAQMVSIRLTGLLEANEFTKAAQVYEEAAAKVSDPGPMTLAMASGFARLGYPQKAIEYDIRYLQRNPNDLDARLALARLHLGLRNFEEAEKESKTVLMGRSGDPTALVVLAQSYIGRNLGDKAVETVMRLMQTSQNDPRLPQWLANLYVGVGHPDAAVRALMHARDQFPDNLPLQERLVRLYLMLDRRDDAKREVDVLLNKWPQRPEGYALTMVFLRDREADRALKVLKVGAEKMGKSPAVALLTGLAQQVSGDLDGAIATWRGMQEFVTPEGLRATYALVGMLLANAYAAKGDLAAAHAVDTGIGKEESLDPVAQYGLLAAIAALDKTRREEAAMRLNLMLTYRILPWPAAQIAELDSLVKLLPENPIIGAWRASAAAGAGDVERAIADLRMIVATNPKAMEPKFVLARVYMQHGQPNSAVPVLEDLSNRLQGPRAAVAFRMLGTIYERENKPELAITAYRNAATASDAEVYARNNLAWLLAARQSNPIDALPYAKKAADLAPRSPEVQDTLGWVYYLQGDYAKAVKTLEQARALAPWMAVVRYHLGAAYAGAGRGDDARRELVEAFAISSSFAGDAEARELLARLSPK